MSYGGYPTYGYQVVKSDSSGDRTGWVVGIVFLVIIVLVLIGLLIWAFLRDGNGVRSGPVGPTGPTGPPGNGNGNGKNVRTYEHQLTIPTNGLGNVTFTLPDTFGSESDTFLFNMLLPAVSNNPPMSLMPVPPYATSVLSFAWQPRVSGRNVTIMFLGPTNTSGYTTAIIRVMAVR